MTLTEEQFLILRGGSEGKTVQYKEASGAWINYAFADSYHPRLFDPRYIWRIEPQTITITIPRPVDLNGSGKNTAWIDFASPSDVKAFIDAVRGA